MSHHDPIDGRSATATARPAEHARAKRFLTIFLLLVLGGMGLLAGVHAALAYRGLLPAPPLVATNCIDEKFALLRDTPLDDRTMIAVGSSATWRNLDMAVLERGFPGARAYNAAPCYLHIDQTDYMTDFLLDRMPRVDTVIVVVAPRDFEACPAPARAFFDRDLADAYLDGLIPRWLPYVTGFRPVYLAREVLDPTEPKLSEEQVAEDRYGSSILRFQAQWRPAPAFDETCYSALSALEETVAEHGARLVLATLPVMPEWRAAFDPDGKVVETWTRKMQAALKRPDTLLIDGRALDWGDERFADPVHVLYPHHTAFSDFVAQAMKQGSPHRLAQGD